MTNTVLRITRHPLDADRMQFLQAVYGDDVKVVTEDVPYGDDPVAAVKALIERTEQGGDKVVAIEAQAPFPVTMKLVDRHRDLGVALIRAQFERDEGGRAIVVGQDEGGRDLLKFSHFEELERIEFQVRRLGETSPEPVGFEEAVRLARDRVTDELFQLEQLVGGDEVTRFLNNMWL